MNEHHSNKSSHNQMDPVSGEHVEVDGVYENEWGRVEKLDRGDVFPADPQNGTTEWELIELDFDNHHDGRTDPRLIPKDDDDNPEAHMQHPRRHKGSNKTDK
ncbi:transposase [Paenibacillus sp. NEAU-GSW1]|uniref:transposase n=1 Tax=Paenibacillus sp. NEAU-GSW1 TaxID=2682486 RepID=UPI0012E23D11|nr:transposase [Paenibacillus sp. NEAU-GSW1]MUT65992.1 transposase [Paenibacillus sp. NEAU-GSW1]